MFKVYFVDDAKYLLDELMGIIDWQSYGYEIAGSNIDPCAAEREILEIKPDLVICDIHMNRLNGLELAARVVKNNSATAFCFLSAYNKFEYAVTAIKLGAVDYLTKPIKPEELIAVIVSLKQKILNNVFDKLLEYALIRDDAVKMPQSVETQITRSGILRDTREIRIIVLSGNVEIVEFSRLANEIYLIYADSKQAILLAESIDSDCLRQLPASGISVGVSDRCRCPSDLVKQLKTAKLLARGEFISGRCELSIYSGESRIRETLEKIGSADSLEALSIIIDGLKQAVILSRLRIDELDAVYKSLIKKSLVFGAVLSEEYFGPLSVTELYADIDEMIFDIRQKLLPDSAAPIKNSAVASIISEIKARPDKKQSLVDYAKRYGYNTAYLSALFRKYAGKSFMEYVIETRMEKAKAMIAASTQTLQEAAQAVGYEDYFYFSKLFKRYQGVSPSEYRASNL